MHVPRTMKYSMCAKLVVTLLIFCCMSSCGNKQNLEKFITNNNYKYWLVVKDTMMKKAKTIYYFDNKGVWNIYTMLVDGNIEKFNASDIVLSSKWELLNDSSVEIGGRNYKIGKLNRKEFVYSYEDKTVITLIEASDSITSSLRKMQSK